MDDKKPQTDKRTLYDRATKKLEGKKDEEQKQLLIEQGKAKYNNRMLFYTKTSALLAFIGLCIAFIGLCITLGLFFKKSEPNSSSGNERYLQAWVLYDEINHTVPLHQKYMDEVLNLIRNASLKDASLKDAPLDEPSNWHIFLIAHGDSTGDDDINKEKTDYRVCYINQIIDASLALENKKLQEWYSKTNKLLWSLGNEMMIAPSLHSKAGECQNRRVHIIATTNPELVKSEYNALLKSGKLHHPDMTDKKEDKMYYPLSKQAKEMLENCELRAIVPYLK